MFCVRDEPVLFLHRENDFVPYSTRTLETIHDSASPQFKSAEQIDDHEAALQKEVCQHIQVAAFSKTLIY